ncbi:GNAT family N-acetyltransferase [Curtobacterium sp. ISL-83]|uniref:GNAT family N-acetyltransferase n=1 Tax=Curtobacterium sp. ISL-83 TaxID=2819145 RepID=UPI001BEBE34F|nr:GNAT family N-acetyltransferase [Curtobacterium sp. ISL-83]MBT2501546.1 GNAT family N-acetyltransferase [Curtobacterium sp. ISL-83]
MTQGAARIRRATPSDAEAMARVHVESWRRTYRGVMRDEVLDDPGFIARREAFWTAVLTEDRFALNRIAVAEAAVGDTAELVGIAMAGPAIEHHAEVQLYVLYLLDEHHGSGTGNDLLAAVVAPHESATLWVADPNPRAQAFYRKHGFVPDGAVQVDDGVRELRLVRSGTDRHD